MFDRDPAHMNGMHGMYECGHFGSTTDTPCEYEYVFEEIPVR